MNTKIITIKFDKKNETYDDEVFQEFGLRNKIISYKSNFFHVGENHYITFIIEYENETNEEKRATPSEKKDEIENSLDEQQLILYKRLKEIRKDRALELGRPVYLLATNSEISKIVLNKCKTVEELKNIKGFGIGKINDIGREFIEVVRKFYNSEEDKNA